MILIQENGTEGGENKMFEIKKVTSEQSSNALNPCSPEAGNCQPSAECTPANP